mmetsp:Transcript_7899/g.18125  ORF Transcript_7899/g.18125 Transcript_7899/m.18125 type:complete len:280 (-) Transcript_7899:34-873(-)
MAALPSALALRQRPREALKSVALKYGELGIGVREVLKPSTLALRAGARAALLPRLWPCGELCEAARAEGSAVQASKRCTKCLKSSCREASSRAAASNASHCWTLKPFMSRWMPLNTARKCWGHCDAPLLSTFCRWTATRFRKWPRLPQRPSRWRCHSSSPSSSAAKTPSSWAGLIVWCLASSSRQSVSNDEASVQSSCHCNSHTAAGDNVTSSSLFSWSSSSFPPALLEQQKRPEPKTSTGAAPAAAGSMSLRCRQISSNRLKFVASLIRNSGSMSANS